MKIEWCLLLCLIPGLLQAQQYPMLMDPCFEQLDEGAYESAYPTCQNACLESITAPYFSDTVKVNACMLTSNAYFDGGYYDEAIWFNERALEVCRTEHADVEWTYNYTYNLFNLAYLAGRGSLVYSTGQTFIKLADSLYGSIDPIVPSVLSLMGSEYLLEGKFAEAEIVLNEAADRQLGISGGPDSSYIAILISLSEVYQLIGDFDATLTTLDRVLFLADSLGLQDAATLSNGHSLKMLAYSQLNLFDEMVTEMNFVLELISVLPPEIQSTYFINMVISLIDYDLKNGTTLVFDVGLDTISQQVLVRMKEFGADPIWLGNAHMSIGNMYLMAGEFDSVYVNYAEASRLVESRYGKNNQYLAFQNTLAVSAEKMGRLDLAYDHYQEIIFMMRTLLGESYPYLPESTQSFLMQSIEFPRSCLYSFYYRHQDQFPDLGPEISSMALLMQGAVLRNSTGMRNRLLQSGNQAEVEKWLALRQQAAELQFSDPKTAGNILIAASKMEKDFSFRMKEQLPDADQFNWQNIRSSLKGTSASIQFIRAEPEGYFYSESPFYFALITRADLDGPQLVPLCLETDLIDLFQIREQELSVDHIQRLYTYPDADLPEDTLLYNGDILYKLIWKPLEAFLSDIDTIYYSPSGLLHKIAFQAISLNEEEMLMDRFTLLQRRNLTDTEGASEQLVSILGIGGIQYSSKVETDMLAANSEDRGSNWGALPGTLLELKVLDGLAKEHGIPFQSLSAEMASEERIRNTSLLNSSVIHIGTHGFFLPYPEVELDSSQPGYLFKNATDPLLRSGLLLAGGNDAWIHGSKTAFDGILTAQEISNLNLLQTQLVVLSACETGLGDIQGDEGVYGLQRAFAMAGAQSLIISLWKVPDQYTAELMQRFYAHLLDGLTPAESLRLAQMGLRKKTGPYNWAAFVLIE